jgi:hypothetical protein
LNIPICINQIYPNARSGVDFVVRDDGQGQFISLWNIDAPKPTTEELAVAWEQYLLNPPPKQKTQIEILQETVDQLVLDNLLG